MMSSDEQFNQENPFGQLPPVDKLGKLELQTGADDDVVLAGNEDNSSYRTPQFARSFDNGQHSQEQRRSSNAASSDGGGGGGSPAATSPTGSDSFRVPTFGGSLGCGGRSNYDLGELQNKLDSFKKWSYQTYKCQKQAVMEQMGKSARTVDIELEKSISELRLCQKKYAQLLTTVQTYTRLVQQMTDTQAKLADSFASLSDSDSEQIRDCLHQNAVCQRAIIANGHKLLSALELFNSSLQTLVNKTITDTIDTVYKFDQARLEFDAYRADLETLHQQPGGSVGVQGKIHAAEQKVTGQKKKYEQLRDDVQVKMAFLEENRVTVMEKQLKLFHDAIIAYYSGNAEALQKTLNEFSIRPRAPPPSFLEQVDVE